MAIVAFSNREGAGVRKGKGRHPTNWCRKGSHFEGRHRIRRKRGRTTTGRIVKVITFQRTGLLRGRPLRLPKKKEDEAGKRRGKALEPDKSRKNKFDWFEIFSPRA